ncbi:MAG: insulinase family protein [Prevotellaceae bacterium]|jgi:predicted Zn-dependent peptidase|nr:insulinase family protein [Prevotellaceae bacterium]
MNHRTVTLPNGVSIIHRHDASPVVYCGFIVDAGSRDETPAELGMAHFIEHMLFKGTKKRRASHIINRLENVGGELNAFTGKEETVVYSSVLKQYWERAVELLADMVFNSVFAQKEIDREVEVILDEISLYNDTPTELIFDDFEDLLYKNHSAGHNILGTPETLKTFSTDDAQAFVNKNYTPGRITFFFLGDIPFDNVRKRAERYFQTENATQPEPRIVPAEYAPTYRVVDRGTFQAHVAIGNRAYSMYHPDKTTLFLLNNIVGGPGMNSLLNLSLREKHGLVYNVESNYQQYTDAGAWCVYFGCDHESVEKCEKLVYKELKKLREQALSEQALKKYKLQLQGQIAIEREQKESYALSLGKNFLRHNRVGTLQELFAKIESITPAQLLETANRVFNPDNLTVLKYTKTTR